jgi:very-short-patch-repair endonuclease
MRFVTISPDDAPVLPCWINGRALLTLVSTYHEIRHAVSGKPLRRVPVCGAEEAREAIAAAKAALPSWQAQTRTARQAILLELAAQLEAHQAHFVRILVEETGKAEEAARSELAAALQALRGSECQDAPDVVVLTWEDAEPLGGAARLAAPCLRGGSTVILKPPHTAPGAAFALLELSARAGLPAGVANLVQGDATTLNALGLGNDARQKARDLRGNMTNAELLLWQRLRGGRFLGVKFHRQRPIGPYIADFAAPSRKLVIELDGGQHAEPAAVAHDAARTRFLESRGYTVMRFWNHDCLARTDSVLDTIERWLREHQ